jgi:hypothetical protein
MKIRHPELVEGSVQIIAKMKAKNIKRARISRSDEDAFDIRVCKARENDPRESHESVKRRLLKRKASR